MALNMALFTRSLRAKIFIRNCAFSSLTSKYVKYFVKRKRDFTACFFCQTSDTQHQNAAQNRKKTAAGDAQSLSTFEEMLESRRQEAQRSVLVQVQSEQSCGELFTYCSQYGTVKSMHHYTMAEANHYVLVEFNHETSVWQVLNSAGHLESEQVMPVTSPFLWFRMSSAKTKTDASVPLSLPIFEQSTNSLPSKKELNEWMLQTQSLSDQMFILYNATKLSDLGSRLRFLTALQVERALSGPFANIRAIPFGSTVNGFGKLSCDLDLVVELDREVASPESRLIFQAKPSLANGRTQMQRHIEMIGDICQLFLPGCANVRRILHARVPIIKYRQEITGVDCDLSMTNKTAVYMSELLFLLGEVDDRVRPLVQALRVWARDVGLTNTSPGNWITNFSLTLLVLFFLQQPTAGAHPILPSLNTLTAIAASSDIRITEDGVNCTFIRDARRLQEHLSQQPQNTDSLEQLFLSFLNFYVSFDFQSNAISLTTATATPKPEYSAMYIVNPLERRLNVSKNVSLKEVEHFKTEIRNTLWILDDSLQRPERPDRLWGLVAICELAKLKKKDSNIFSIPTRLREKTMRVNISELFETKEDEEKEEEEEKEEKENKNKNKKVLKYSDVVPPTFEGEQETVMNKRVKLARGHRKR